jgi:hypothetical protein
LGTGYKWIGFENGLWMPVKRINLNGVRKAGVDGWDINWHTLTPNYNETSFNRVVGSIDDAVLQQKVRNRRRCIGCRNIAYVPNWLNTILGTIQANADENCGLVKLSKITTQTSDDNPINWDRVNKFKKDIKEGEKIKPLLVYERSDGRILLADGHHRYIAYDELGVSPVPVLFITKAEYDAYNWSLSSTPPKF